MRIRARGKQESGFAPWTHAALVVSWHGHLVEALPTGVVLTAMEKYRERDYHYVRVELSDAERATVARYAVTCLRRRHGGLSRVLLALATLVGGRSRRAARGRYDSSALSVRALQQAGLHLGSGPTEMSGADLAKWLGVRP